MKATKLIQVGIGAAFIIVGGLQANSALFGAKWSGIVLVLGGIAIPALVYVDSQLGGTPPVTAPPKP